MVAIPQIFRDKIASSVVGTPGVNPAGAEIGQAFAKAGEESFNAVAPVLEEQTNVRNEMAYNQAMFQHNNTMVAALEDIKIKYANNPDAAGPAMMDAIKNSRDSLAANIQNPFVKMRVAGGDPRMEFWNIKEAYQWSSQQEFNILNKGNQDFLNKSSEDMSVVAANPHNTAEDVMNYMTPYLNGAVKREGMLKASKNPQLAEGFMDTTTRSLAISTIDGALSATRPALAAQLLNNPEFNKFLKPSDKLQLERATAQMAQEWPKIMMDKAVLNKIGSEPELLSGVESGKMGAAGVDAWARKNYPQALNDSTEDKPTTPEGTFIKYTRAIAATTQLATQGAQRQETQLNIFSSASNLGKIFSNDVAKLSQVGANGKVDFSKDIKDLFGLRNDIVGAQAKGLITAQEAQTYLTHVYDPLASMVLKQHRPGIFETKNPGEVIQGVTRWMGQPDSSAKVAEFQTASKIIENSFAHNNITKTEDKVQLYDSYFKAADKYLQPGKINPLTNAAYTAADIANAVAGQGLGDYINVPGLGLKKVTGYNAKGSPTFDTSKEEEDKLSQGKILSALYKGK